MNLLLILALLSIVLWAVEPAVKRWSDPKRGADKLQRALREIYAAHHDLVEVRWNDFPHLDLAFYDSTAKTFAEHGFRILGDLEDRTVSGKVLARRTFIRCLTDDAGVGVGIYNFQLAGWARWVVPFMRNLRIVDIGSEFSDGTFLNTSNAWHARHVKLPPEIDTVFHRLDTLPHVLLQAHHERRDAYLSQHPGVTPIVISAVQDEIASGQRSSRLKAAFRAQSKYQMTRDELRAHAGDMWLPGTAKAAEDLADAIDGAASSRPSRPGRRLAYQVFGWMLLVVIFAVAYRWTAH